MAAGENTLLTKKRKSKRGFRSGGAGKSESEDRSQPTIVDEEKDAGGLRQLRGWYQREDQSDPGATTGNPAPAPTSSVGGPQPPAPAGSLGGPQARPTAVGHATAPPASAAQRPIAPDPMRATMFGHDVRQFDLDLAATGGEATPSASSTDLVLPDPGGGQHAITRQAGAVPAAVAWPQSDSFNLARGEAARMERPAGIRRSIRPQTRVPVMARVMIAVGMAAFVAAIAIAMWLLSGSDSDSSSAQPSPEAIPTSPARTPPPAAAPEAPARPPTTAPPAVPVPNVAAPKIGPRAPTTPARLRTPRKPREAKVDETRSGSGDDDKAAGATTPPAAKKEAPAAKPHADPDETLPPSEGLWK
jgi:hypothetical protein